MYTYINYLLNLRQTSVGLNIFRETIRNYLIIAIKYLPSLIIIIIIYLFIPYIIWSPLFLSGTFLRLFDGKKNEKKVHSVITQSNLLVTNQEKEKVLRLQSNKNYNQVGRLANKGVWNQFENQY